MNLKKSFSDQAERIYGDIKEKLKPQMEKDKKAQKEGTFKNSNDHGVKIEMDQLSYFKIYVNFSIKQFHTIFARKTSYKGNFKKFALELHEQKMLRFVIMKIRLFLLNEKANFFSDE